MRVLLYRRLFESEQDEDEIRMNMTSELLSDDEDVIYMDRNGNIIDVNLVISTVNDVISDIRINHPELYRILLNKTIDVVDSVRFDTMATDGASIFISPVFVQQLLVKGGPRAVGTVILHEMMHILFDHCGKEGKDYPDHGRANAAQDFEINYFIENFITEVDPDDEDERVLPYEGMTEVCGGLIDNKFGNMGWKSIYKEIGDEYSTHKLIETPDEWKNGFVDGFNEIMSELVKDNKVSII